jgi:hypothetical protein
MPGTDQEHQDLSAQDAAALEFASAFDTAPEEEGTTEEETTEEKSNETTDDKEKSEIETKKADAEGEKKEEPELSAKEKELQETNTSLEKAVKDNQTAFTQARQENAELKQRLEKLETSANEKETELSDDDREYMEDNPVVKKLVDSIGKIEEAMKGVKPDAATDQISQMNWQNGVTSGVMVEGKWVPGHPDAGKYIYDPDFFEFYKKETGIDTITLEKPSQTIEVITKFKDAQAKEKADGHDEETKKKAAAIEKDARATVETGNKKQSIKPEEPDENGPNAFEKAFNEEIK